VSSLLLTILILLNITLLPIGVYLLKRIEERVGYKAISKHPLPPIIIRKIYIDRAFTTKERTIIKTALSQWEKITNGLVRLRIIDSSAISLSEGYHCREQHSYDEYCSRIYLSKALSSDDKIQEIDAYEKTNIWGYAYMTYVPRIAIIVTDRIPNEQQLQKIIIHEIGHLLGIPHGSQHHSLMHQYCSASKKQQITEEDLRYIIRTALRDVELQYRRH